MIQKTYFFPTNVDVLLILFLSTFTATFFVDALELVTVFLLFTMVFFFFNIKPVLLV